MAPACTLNKEALVLVPAFTFNKDVHGLAGAYTINKEELGLAGRFTLTKRTRPGWVRPFAGWCSLARSVKRVRVVRAVVLLGYEAELGA